MSIQKVNATIQMRIGDEEDFDPYQMTAGEWAVSKDVKYVRMCFTPGLCLRMATYEAFEQDMHEIQLILATCQDIQVAVEQFMQLAEQHASQAEEWSVESKSWAVGGTGTREGEDTNNSKYFSDLAKTLTDEAQKLLEQAQKIIAASTTGALVPAGTVAFEDLPTSPIVGYMYNISNDFTTDSRFVEGAGVFYRAGANVYWTADEKWDVMIGTQVTGVKGNSETSYRVGNVNLTPQNIGALSLSGGTTSGDIVVKKEGDTGAYFRAKRGSNDVLFGIGIDKQKRGIYDISLNKWVVDINDDGAKFRGTAEYAEKIPLTENLLATVPGTALDATMGKQLKDELDSSLKPIVAGVTANSSYMNLMTFNEARRYAGLNIAIIGGSFKTIKVIPANTTIDIANVSDLIANPISQHNISISNNRFINAICWMGIDGTFKFFAQSDIPVGTWIHFSDCYIYNPIS